MDGHVASQAVTFGKWRFESQPAALFRIDGSGRWVAVAMGSRALDILTVLLREPGALVTKDALMDTVWPNVTVEPNNLTVQIASLRRVLDKDCTSGSLIQTVPGRGYQFVAPVVPSQDCEKPIQSQQTEGPAASPSQADARPGYRLRVIAELGACLGVLMVILVATYGLLPDKPPMPPRMSVAVLPFENLGGSDDSRLAEALTDDLAAALAIIGEGFDVLPDAHYLPVRVKLSERTSSQTRRFRYVLEGTVRKLGPILRVNSQLLATDDGSVLWTDRFDVATDDPTIGQETAVNRIYKAVLIKLIAVEDLRSRKERPDHPDALDLVLHARSLDLENPSPARMSEGLALYERALALNPSSDAIKLQLATQLMNAEDAAPQGRKAVLQRTSDLLAGARGDNRVGMWGRFVHLYWLQWQYDRCAEVLTEAAEFIADYPREPSVQRWIGDCRTRTGQAIEAIPALRAAIRLNGETAWQGRNYRNMQFALLLLGRYDESIAWGFRAIATNPEDFDWDRARIERRLAASYALTGRLDEARQRLDAANRINPFFTLRALTPGPRPNAVYAAQFQHLIEGLRLAGLRDHADEDADFAVPTDGRINPSGIGPTPLVVPGAITIRTEDLLRLISQHNPVLIDALWNFGGRSIPNAIGLRYVGDGGDLHDVAEDLLRTKMQEITGGDLAKPVVAVGWNSETFDGRNLALRLAAIGYTQVYWYRGGREAWEVRGLPEADLVPQAW